MISCFCRSNVTTRYLFTKSAMLFVFTEVFVEKSKLETTRKLKSLFLADVAISFSLNGFCKQRVCLFANQITHLTYSLQIFAVLVSQKCLFRNQTERQVVNSNPCF